MKIKRYRRKANTTVVAIQLDLKTDGFTYEKWGGTQTCKPGDWLVSQGGDTYTVDRESFARTYLPVGEGQYRKASHVWARQMEEPGSVRTREGRTAYEAGDYLVSNDERGDDSYAVSKDKFEALYDPAD